MLPLLMLMAAGAIAGAAADRKRPMRGALLGAGIGATGGALGGVAAGAGAAGAGAAGAGAAGAGAAGAGAAGAGAAGTAGLLGTEAAAGTAGGAGLLGGEAAGAAGSSGLLGSGSGAFVGEGAASGVPAWDAAANPGFMSYLKTAGEYTKPIGQAMNAANQVGSMFAGRDKPAPAPAPQITGGYQTLAEIANAPMLNVQSLQQAEQMRQKRRMGLLGGNDGSA